MKSFAVIALITVMLLTTVSVVFATYTPFTEEESGETHYLTDGPDTLHPFIDGTWFYRTNPGDTSDEWLYGYGYGIPSGSEPGTPAEYGYGFGYGYDYGYLNNEDWWNLEDNAAQMGYFMGDYGEFSVPPDTALPVELELTGSGAIEGITVLVPEGVILTGPEGWDGTITVTGSDESENFTGFADGDAVFVNVDLGVDGDVLMDMPVVVTIPYAGFDAGLVQATFDGDVYTIDECTDDQFIGEVGEEGDPASYVLADGNEEMEHCYTYDDDAVYVATNHFSEFGAGAGAEADDDDDGGGSSGGSSSDDEDEDEGVSSVDEFVDLVNLTEENWEYDVIQDALDLGLFNGEKNAAGESVFNPYNNMNRAQAAQVMANYIGCEDTTLTVAPFSDVALDVWYAQPIACLKEKGIVSGKTPTVFDPAGNVTRMEFFKMSVESYLVLHPEMAGSFQVLMDVSSTYFTDVKPTDWFYGYTNLAVYLGLLNGYVENGLHVLKPNQAIYRVEGAAMMVRLIAL